MKTITNVRETVFGTFGELNGKEVEFCRATKMWAYTDGSGYIYGAESERNAPKLRGRQALDAI